MPEVRDKDMYKAELGVSGPRTHISCDWVIVGLGLKEV